MARRMLEKAENAPPTRNTESNVWRSLLNSLRNTKDLTTTATLIILGGDEKSYSDIYRELSQPRDDIGADQYGSQGADNEEPPRLPGVGLGYSYVRFYDETDSHDVISRLDIYTVPYAEDFYLSRVKRILDGHKDLKDVCFCLVLDWKARAAPFSWVSQLAAWIVFLQRLADSLDPTLVEECKEKCKNIIQTYRYSDDYPASSGDPSTTPLNSLINTDQAVLPLDEGQYDSPVGLPFFVDVVNSQYMTVLERQHSWKEQDFDLVQQFIRTIILKHGAPLIYSFNASIEEDDISDVAITSQVNSRILHTLSSLVPELISLDHRKKLLMSIKPQVLKRDSVFVPSGWDSWVKIETLGEGLPIREISEKWQHTLGPSKSADAVIAIYRQQFEHLNPPAEAFVWSSIAESEDDQEPPPLEVTLGDWQDFLVEQQSVLDTIKRKDDAGKLAESKGGAHSSSRLSSSPSQRQGDSNNSYVQTGNSPLRLEAVGQADVNAGNIQITTPEEVQRKRQERQADLAVTTTSQQRKQSNMSSPVSNIDSSPAFGHPGRHENEALASFFHSILQRRGSSSPNSSPATSASITAGVASPSPHTPTRPSK